MSRNIASIAAGCGRVTVATVSAFGRGLRRERRVAWSRARGWVPVSDADRPGVFVRSLRMDGYDHGADGTLPRSAVVWPSWLILALRPWFAAGLSPAVRREGVAAFRAGFVLGLGERR